MKYQNPIFSCLILTALLLGLCLPALAQTVEFEPLLIKRNINCLLERGDKMVAGLDGGGLLFWDRSDPEQYVRLSAGTELSGNDVKALAWTGRYVWVATLGGGMTRIDNLETEPEYRQYASNLGSLDITAVTGQVIGSSERVYYGMDAGGIGLITDGLSGAIYTAEQDGLIDNNINDLQIFNGELFAATPSGISRFSNNLFNDVNDGLTSTIVHELALDPDGNLVCGGDGQIYLWDPVAESWSSLGWSAGSVSGLDSNDEYLWALGLGGGSTGSVGYFDGTQWNLASLPYSRTEALSVGANIWVGGRYVAPGMNTGATGLAYYAQLGNSANWSEYIVDAPLVFNASGLTFDSEGRSWVGSYGGNAMSGVLGDEITSVYEVATADNDSTGLFNHFSNMLTMAADHQGLVYSAQYTSGIVRHDIKTDETDLIWTNNSGLLGRFIIKMETHPDGSLIIMHDWADEQKVEVLTDPLHWHSEDNWLYVPQGSEGIGAGIGVWDALVERNDVIWFAVEGTGLVRWDINGNSAGPDDEITWHDLSDDQWFGPIDNIPGTSNSPAQAVALALAPDGTIWYGGNGITRFAYDEVFGDVELQEAYSAKTASYQAGLITGNVADLAVDSNGDLWVATVAGLNCVRWDQEDPVIDAYFDLENYFANSTYALLYSPNVISALPGGLYRRLAASADGSRLSVASAKGAVAWDVPETAEEEEGSLSALFLYPNPWVVEDSDSRLKLGGIPADADNNDPALVEIYNLEGQLVYKNSLVGQNVGFWTGLNRVGSPVASGMYMVKVTWRDQITTRSLAVVR